MGEGEIENLLPSPKIGRGAGGEGKTHAVRRFQLKFTPMIHELPIQYVALHNS